MPRLVQLRLLGLLIAAAALLTDVSALQLGTVPGYVLHENTLCYSHEVPTLVWLNSFIYPAGVSTEDCLAHCSANAACEGVMVTPTSSLTQVASGCHLVSGIQIGLCGPSPFYNVWVRSQSPGGGAAVGDPHLQNVHGERFDLMKPGKHVLINIPRGELAENALLRVQADARQLGVSCSDMYFQELNVTGSWAEATHAGGYRYVVGDPTTSGWLALGKVELKVVHGYTESGIQYLNFFVKHLSRAGFDVGGLLGEDDHEDVIIPPAACAKRMSLLEMASGAAKHPFSASVARAW